MSVTPKSLVGVVVSAGKMQRAVKVRVAGQVFNTFLQKHFRNHTDYLVSDPNDSIRLGDVIRIEDAGRKLSTRIKHVIAEIVSPWGAGIEERPPVLSAEERHAIWQQRYEAKVKRRKEEREAQKNSDNVGVREVGKIKGRRKQTETKKLRRETVR